ncbi:MAG TPA: ATP-binding protein, partial [Alphaproteobacteria bacterium]
DYDVRVYAVGNKIQNEDDSAFLQAKCGNDLIGVMPVSTWVKRRERGDFQPFSALDETIRAILSTLIDTATAHPRDWVRYWYWGIHFHRKNALNWGNQSVGFSVEDWIDRDFLQNFAGQTPAEQSHAA